MTLLFISVTWSTLITPPFNRCPFVNFLFVLKPLLSQFDSNKWNTRISWQLPKLAIFQDFRHDFLTSHKSPLKIDTISQSFYSVVPLPPYLSPSSANHDQTILDIPCNIRLPYGDLCCYTYFTDDPHASLTISLLFFFYSVRTGCNFFAFTPRSMAKSRRSPPSSRRQSRLGGSPISNRTKLACILQVYCFFLGIRKPIQSDRFNYGHEIYISGRYIQY